MADDQITLHAFTVEQTTIKVDAAAHAATVAHGDAANEYDHDLSDMDGQTVIVQPDGAVLNPYGDTTDLLELVRPILAHIPTWRIDQYAASRRAEEE